MENRYLTAGFICALTLLLAGSADVYSQSTTLALQKGEKSATTREGSGYMVAGDLWTTVHPVNMEFPNLMRSSFAGLDMNYIMMLGSTGNWREPANSWPAGYPYTNTFRNSPLVWATVYDREGWAGYAPGNRLRDLDASVDAAGADGTSRFMFPTYGADIVGAGDPARDYRRAAVYTDASRTHLVYEAGWPTTAGIDFRIRAHQYSSNEQNLNDFIAIEISMTNTGVVDSDGDGKPEETENRIDGIAWTITGDVSPSIFIGTNGDRGGNKLAAGRTFGYVAATDAATGEPYDIFAWFANVPPAGTTNQTVPPLGERAFGIDNTTNKLGYSDIWNAWKWMGTRQGTISQSTFSGISAISSGTADKSTVFGTHSVGHGAQRGWYNSSHWQSGLANRRNSDLSFRSATATWYEDYGKLSNGGDILPNLAPNSAFFSGGTPDDITTWVVGNPGGRPNGDLKYGHLDVGTGVQVVEQPIWESAWNSTASSGDFYSGVQGYSKEYTFGQAPQLMHGPMSLEVGESMTTVLVVAAGFRLEGVAEAMKAAQWAWDHGWDLSVAMPTPAAPDIQLTSTDNATTRIRWMDVSHIRPVDGYKIWKASVIDRIAYLEAGLRAMDRYHHQHDPSSVLTDAFLDPVNPSFDVGDPAVYFSGKNEGVYRPAEWGTYDLVANIPEADLGQFADATGGYDYSFEDLDVATGTYWYYVSAYTEGSFAGPLGPLAVRRLESANFNRNGRNDPTSAEGTIGLGTLWSGTYPYAYRNPDFPAPWSEPLRSKNMGAPFHVSNPKLFIGEVSPSDVQKISPGSVYTFTVHVEDADNIPVSGAVVSVHDGLLDVVVSLDSTDATGKAVYTAVAQSVEPGTYVIYFRAEKVGYGFAEPVTRMVQVVDESEFKLTASDGAQSHEFGRSVSVSGDVAVVGAASDSYGVAAYIYRFDGLAWTEEQKLTASDGSSGAFGFSASVSGDVAIVGAPRDDEKGQLSGAAYVFRYDGSAWVEEQKLTASDGAEFHDFGWSVAVSADVAVVGAFGDDDSGDRAGAAYVYRYTGDAWVEEQKLTASDGATEDMFGISVAVKGDVAIVGAWLDDDDARGSGSAYVYRYVDGAWTEEQKLTATDGAAYDYFGTAVSVNGDVVLVGAVKDDDYGRDSGSAYAYRYTDGTWLEEQKLIASDGAEHDEFGGSVSVSGNLAIVGANWDDDNGEDSGSAYVFRYSAGRWQEERKLSAVDGKPADRFGISVSVSGNIAIAGAVDDDDLGTDSGAAYVYDLSLTGTFTEDLLDVPVGYRLKQNYPNPFNPSTTITYALPRAADVTLTVFDLLGRQVRVIASGTRPAGHYEVSFDAEGLPSGVYVYRLEADSFTETRSMVVIK